MGATGNVGPLLFLNSPSHFQFLVIMTDDRSSKLLLVFFVFAFLLNFPLLEIVDHQPAWHGFPGLYFYLFLVWLVLIVAVGLIFRKKT